MTLNSSHYKQLLDSQSTSIVLLDHALQVCFINPAAELLLQTSHQRSIGESIAPIIGEEHMPALRACLSSGHSYTSRETELARPDQSTITVDYTASQVTDVKNQKKGLLLELHNRDRLIRISKEEQMLATQEMTRSLVRGMAHEIKNPLGGIRGAAQLLNRELPDESLAEYTTIIIEEADRLRDLVDRLLGPHKLPQFELLNIHEVMERVYQLVEVETNHQLKIRRDYDPSMPNIYVDKSQLIQVILNICQNAIQAMTDNTEAPQLTLKTRVIRQFTIGQQKHRLVAQIQICDNGPGIPEHIKDDLFYPMVTGRAEGTGLGLSIAQTLINHHQGIIEFSSEPGDTQFSIYLPFSKPEKDSITK